MLAEIFKANDVITLKLVSGEEVIARLESDEDNVYRLAKPATLVADQGQPALAPFMMTAKNDASVVIDKSKVITVTKTQEQMAEQYTQQTTSIQT